jgi:hypothetical protein
VQQQLDELRVEYRRVCDDAATARQKSEGLTRALEAAQLERTQV